MLFSEKLPSLFAFDGLRGKGRVRAAHDRLYLEGRDCVAHDVAHVGDVPIEAFEILHRALSIYAYRIYNQSRRFAPSTKT